MESPDFLVIKKVGNRAAVDTYTFDTILFQFCVKIAILINFTQNSNLKKFCLKTTMVKSDIFLFNKPLLMVAIMGKYFQCATRLIFKSIWCLVLTSSTLKCNRPRLGNFREKPLRERAQIFV